MFRRYYVSMDFCSAKTTKYLYFLRRNSGSLLVLLIGGNLFQKFRRSKKIIGIWFLIEIFGTSVLFTGKVENLTGDVDVEKTWMIWNPNACMMISVRYWEGMWDLLTRNALDNWIIEVSKRRDWEHHFRTMMVVVSERCPCIPGMKCYVKRDEIQKVCTPNMGMISQKGDSFNKGRDDWLFYSIGAPCR